MSETVTDLATTLLPESWQDELVFGVAEKRDAGWRVVFTDFDVSGSGGTLHEAIDEAGERLQLYLLRFLSERPGEVSFHQTRRPLPPGERMPLLARSIFFHLLGIQSSQRVRLPLRHLTCLDDYEGLQETLEILRDEEALAALREGEEDVRAGRVRSYEEVRRDLGLA